jgi:transcriptional regulator with AAA-type ATPase domain
VSRNGDAPLVTAEARIILLSEQGLPALNDAVDETIKVPPLRVRKADIEDWVNYYLSLICRRRGTGRITVTPEAIRRLQSYDFPNNLRELENLVERAAAPDGRGVALLPKRLSGQPRAKRNSCG